MIRGAQRPQGRTAARRRSGATRNRAEDQRAEARWVTKALAILLIIAGPTGFMFIPALGAVLWRFG